MRRGYATVVICSGLVATSYPAGVRAQIRDGAMSVDAGHLGDDDDTVVVTGERDARTAANRLVKSISQPYKGQIARYEKPICPVVVGLPQAYGAVVENRIRAVARRAKVRVADQNCKPNLTIMVAENGATLVNTLQRKRPIMFSSLASSDIRRLVRSPGPSWSWKVTTPKRRDGGPIQVASQIDFGGPQPMPVSKGAYVVNNAQMSRLYTTIRQDIGHAYVVIEAARTKGVSLNQVADYALMTGLASIRMEGVSAVSEPSILTIFADMEGGHTPPAAITAFDLAYIAALYAGESGISADQKLRNVSRKIARDVWP